MEEYLGTRPENDAAGVLQDVHWSSGAFAYFPSYSLGAMYAAQLYATAQQSIPGLEASIQAGNFRPLKEWLNAKVGKGEGEGEGGAAPG